MENDEKLVTGIDISDEEYKEIVKKSLNEKNISDVDKEKLLKKMSSLSDYTNELDKIVVPGYNNKVIFTNGNKQLVYENGEFFEVSATDATKEKVKLTRKEATDKYVEYFIDNVLNPLIAKKDELGIPKRTKEKEERAEIKKTPKKEIKNKEKDIEIEL